MPEYRGPIGEGRKLQPHQDEPESQAARAPRQGIPAAALLRLQHKVGNRQVAALVARRQLARRPAPPPPKATWASQTTVPNKALGGEIDELDKLDEKDLVRRREELLAKASKWDGDKHKQYGRSLEAIEFVAAQRGLKPIALTGDYRMASDKSTARRRTVRLLIEDGIRQTGSLEDSIDGLTHAPKEFEADFDFFRKEAKEFGDDFTRQARDIAQQMLGKSASEILDTIEDYGLRRSTAIYSANEILHGRPVDKVVEEVIKVADTQSKDDPIWTPEPENPTNDPKKMSRPRKMRISLGQYVRNLKRQQKVVKQLHLNANDMSEWDAWQKASNHLTEMWTHAEAVHPVLAAFRGGHELLEYADLESVDDTKGGSEQQMTSVLTNLFDKLADIGRIQSRISNGSLSPLSLPPVVALTKTVMFVPEGSIRAGKVNDLVDKAQDKDVLHYIAEGLLAVIVLATLIPSGGTSLGVGIGLVSASLSAAYAVQDWESYKRQKILANTALDRAKALSTEEPSLLPFAIDLISLGFDALPLVKAFSKAVDLRNLVHAGADSKAVKNVVNELNDLGKARGEARLGDKALEDVNAAERDAKAGARVPEPTVPAPQALAKTEKELRAAVSKELQQLAKAAENPEWTKLWKGMDRAKFLEKYPTNKRLLGMIDRNWRLVRSPKVAEDGMAKLLKLAQKEKITAQEALERWAGGKPFNEVFGQNPKEFLEAARKSKPVVDRFFDAGKGHGQWTHVFQEYALAQEIGEDAAREFRQLLANAEGPERESLSFASQVWDAVFDEYAEGHINSPEELGPLLQKYLGLQ